jgi:hypothetical protein
MSVLPDEVTRLGEDATLAVLDVRSTELDRAGGGEESAVARLQNGEAGPPEGGIDAEVPRTA